MNRVATWSTAVTVILAGWLAAQATWSFVALWRPVAIPSPPPSSTEPQQVADTAVSYDIDNILATPLFGEKAAGAAPSEDLKRSRLNVKLQGVVASGGQSGVAILFHDGESRAYAVGDRLDVREHVTLEAVYPDHVVVNRRGSREKIELERDRKGADGVKVIQRAEGTVDVDTPYVRRLVGDPRETLKTNPLRLMRFLQLSPYKRNGQTVGYSVQPGRDKRLFPRLGLEPGDVVISINNQPLADANVNDLLKSLDTHNTFELVVLRNGAPETIRLSL